MRSRAAAIAIALSLLALRAWGCEADHGAPAPLLLAGDAAGQPGAVLIAPRFWSHGDPGVVLADDDAFRQGCADPRVARLLEEGMLVVLVRAGTGRAVAARTMLRDGFGAGLVVSAARLRGR